MVDIGQEILYGYGIVRAYFFAFSTSDTGDRATLFRDASFILVDTADKYLTVPLILFPKFNDVLGTGLYTGIACCTVIICYYREAGFRIHMEGIKIA